MQFNGFASLSHYEQEATEHGFNVSRRKAYKEGEEYLLMITSLANGHGISTWHLFSSDESREILDGIIPNDEWLERTGGVDVNYIGVLEKNGFVLR